MNKIFQELHGGDNIPQSAIQMANLFKSANNPKALLETLSKTNPAANQIFSLMNNGTTAKDLFYEMAKQKGINPNVILNLLK